MSPNNKTFWEEWLKAKLTLRPHNSLSINPQKCHDALWCNFRVLDVITFSTVTSPGFLTLYGFDEGEIPLIQEVKTRSAATRLELNHGYVHKQGSFIILQCLAVQEDTHCSTSLTQTEWWTEAHSLNLRYVPISRINHLLHWSSHSQQKPHQSF